MEQSNIKTSGPVSRPVEELVKYIHTLEATIGCMQFDDGSRIHGYQLDIMKHIICPHWNEVIDSINDSEK